MYASLRSPASSELIRPEAVGEVFSVESECRFRRRLEKRNRLFAVGDSTGESVLVDMWWYSCCSISDSRCNGICTGSLLPYGGPLFCPMVDREFDICTPLGRLPEVNGSEF